MPELAAMMRLNLRGLHEMTLAAPILVGVLWLLNWNSGFAWVATLLMILVFMVAQNLFRFGAFASKVPLLDVLPVQRRTVVVSRYLVILAVAVVLCPIIGALIFLVTQAAGGEVPEDWGRGLLTSLGAMLLIIGLILPNWWRPWRSWRTAMAYLPVFGVLGSFLILNAAYATGNLPSSLSSFLDEYGAWLTVTVGVLSFAGSLPITIRAAERLDH
ncbi:MAG: ABC-2 transporter permease [Propionibacteriaceae bacterium]|nr:ABC-2 transporter permease [Propionibacteriaceae bacterium]